MSNAGAAVVIPTAVGVRPTTVGDCDCVCVVADLMKDPPWSSSSSSSS